MPSIDPWAMGAIDVVRAAARRRATTYRVRAAQIAKMAEREPIGKIRTQLLALADRYEGLAADLDPAPVRDEPFRRSAAA
jgi:hypothetical protein